MLEFGLRRAQGPCGANIASKYCIRAGFDGSSNVIVCKHLGIKPSGTVAHS